jgi:hypothetical protein
VIRVTEGDTPMVLCWTVSAGSGTSVVAAGLALVAASRPDGALLVDLGGDQPAILGCREPEGPGVLDWMVEGGTAPPDALGRLEIDVAPGLRLLPAGQATATATRGIEGRAALLATALASGSRSVIVDAGPAGQTCPCNGVHASRHPRTVLFQALQPRAQRSLLVVRPCYLALRRVSRAPVDVDAVVLVAETWRALAAEDVAAVVEAPVVAEVPVEAAIGRAVDAGILAARLPRALERALRPALG